MLKVSSKDGTTIAYEKIGKGSPLILVDGAFCYRKNGTTPMLIPELSKYFTVYAYDRRGRGDSTNTEPYRIEREIEDLQAIGNSIDTTPYVLGMSSGAALALNAVAAGFKVRKLALFEPPYVASGNGKVPPSDAIAELNKMIHENRRSDAVKYYLVKVIGMPSFAAIFIKLMPGVWKKNMAVAHTLPYDLTIMGDFTVPGKAAKSITVPTIVLSGAKSSESLRKAAVVTSELIPSAQYRSLEGMSHMLKPALLTPVLQEFFKD
jgi:pimeloyl-ACP methyl ester carboxylesterase